MKSGERDKYSGILSGIVVLCVAYLYSVPSGVGGITCVNNLC